MNKIYFLLFLLLTSFISCQSEESKIKNVCKTYVEGRTALENGDSLKLRPVTGDTLYKLMLLDRQYTRLLGFELSIPSSQMRSK